MYSIFKIFQAPLQAIIKYLLATRQRQTKGAEIKACTTSLLNVIFKIVRMKHAKADWCLAVHSFLNLAMI